MLDQFMEKLSKDMELEQPFKAKIPNVYTIPLEEDLHVTISSNSIDRYELSSIIGACPSIGKEEFFSRILLANLFGQGTYHAILGLDSEATQLTVSHTIDYHIEYKEFKDIIEDFLNCADQWRGELANASQTL